MTECLVARSRKGWTQRPYNSVYVAVNTQTFSLVAHCIVAYTTSAERLIAVGIFITGGCKEPAVNRLKFTNENIFELTFTATTYSHVH